ncbi:protein prune homolog 2-like isoform X1 [Osmerus eperlanus]|uniref:protein prune homolog 2-like isoform X1 n=2 Tax=Osmerus eperlanus TaxID=29151 RepID=UPI002E11E5F1
METGGKAEHEEDTSSTASSASDGDLSDEPSERSGRAEGEKPAPPNSLALGSEPRKRRLMAPALSLSLGRSESVVSEEFLSAAISPSIDEEDLGLDLDLDAMETPSDSESLHFPSHDLDLEEDFHRLGVATGRPRGRSPVAGPEASEEGSLEQDQTDSQGTRWRCFTTGEPPQKNRVNMSVLEPYLRVLSHGGYHEDGPDDIIVFSSCYLPDNSTENYQYVMDNLFRYVIGTLELMVSQDYVIVYLCALTQRNKLPAIGWLRECYTAIDRRLRKNLKALYVVHPTWYIKALITIIKPFLSSKFSRKLQFISSLEDLSQHVPTEGLQIPDGVRQFDKSMSR